MNDLRFVLQVVLGGILGGATFLLASELLDRRCRRCDRRAFRLRARPSDGARICRACYDQDWSSLG